MPRWHVERVARLDDLIAVAVPDGHAPRHDIAPGRALAAVVRQPLEQRCEVPVVTDRGEDDGIAVELGTPVLGRAVVGYVGRALSRETVAMKHISFGSCPERGNGAQAQTGRPPRRALGSWELLLGSGDESTLILGVLLRSMEWDALARRLCGVASAVIREGALEVLVD
jgi:hypothetical protein